MGTWRTASSPFLDAPSSPTSIVAHVGPYTGPWPILAPPDLQDCTFLEFIVAVPPRGADADDPSVLSFNDNAAYISSQRHWLVWASTPTDSSAQIIDFDCIGNAAPATYPDTVPPGAHLYVRALGAPLGAPNPPNTFAFPANDVGAYVPQRYSPYGQLGVEMAAGTLKPHVPPSQPIGVVGAVHLLAKYVHPATPTPGPIAHASDIVYYMGQQAKAATDPALDTGAHGQGINYGVPHNSPDLPGGPDPGYTCGDMNYGEYGVTFQTPAVLPNATGTPNDFDALRDSGVAAASMPDGSPGYVWESGSVTPLGFGGQVQWLVTGTGYYYQNDAASVRVAVPLSISYRVHEGDSSKTSPLAFLADSTPYLIQGHLLTDQPPGVANNLTIPPPPGVTPSSPITDSTYAIHLYVDGAALPYDATTNVTAEDFAENHTLNVRFVADANPSVEYYVQYPAYDYYAPGDVVSSPRVNETTHPLRLTQRSDGRGTGRFGRLRASTSPPMSAQVGVAPRLGDNNRPI